MTSRRSSLRTSLPSLGDSSAALVWFAPAASKRKAAGLDFVTRWSGREVSEQAAGSPTFLSSPHAPLPCSTTPDGLVVSGLLRHANTVPAATTAKTPVDLIFFRGSITRL